MGFKDYCFRKSLWVFHFGGASCNNCDIEILDCLTPRYDLERFGILLVGSVRHADVLLVNGSINIHDRERLLEIYNQAPKPILVVAIGACGCTGGFFTESYTFAGPVDKIIPVDAYVPGCPPKPEAIIAGIVKMTERRRDGETERRRDGETERRRDGETERRRDGVRERLKENKF